MINTHSKTQEFRFQAEACELCELRKFLRQVIEHYGCREEVGDKIILAVNEACMNVIEHAYEDTDKGEIVLFVEKKSQQLIFKLHDFAKPVDIDSIKPRELDDIRPGGLGTYFINEIMDECERGHLQEGMGNYLIMKKNIC